ncbi:hypothetical protein SAMN05428957_101466 [Oryzisolibacter propanilivorax]|uniref:Uncharacterized protein n=1 Tax=Oryzisolibacter propanilivorax TaxID=1527607 RepID=A0A1G9PLZ2_9BURK|nr:hypothetical protein [Oryzisolibacter propanilivorax]SDL99105.1 hypothetical protein SAMN05428957_101466 [Oryzisolibacter propanilivorax]
MFKRFLDPATIYLRRAQRCMDEARMAALEHESAAEHHAALARMYRERVARLRLEMSPEPQDSRPLAEAPAQGPRVMALKKREDAQPKASLVQEMAG